MPLKGMYKEEVVYIIEFFSEENTDNKGNVVSRRRATFAFADTGKLETTNVHNLKIDLNNCFIKRHE